MEAKLSSASTVGCLARDFGAAESHGDPDIGLAERRGVVDAVTGHRHHLAASWSASTRRSFCSAGTRAKTSVAVASAPSRSSAQAASSAPVTTRGVPSLFSRPALR
jgi:hypothetical protein